MSAKDASAKDATMKPKDAIMYAEDATMMQS